MSDQKKRRILFRFKMFCSVIENFVSKEKQRGKNRMIWSDKKKHSNECFFCVLSVAKNEFFLILILIEITSFFLQGCLHHLNPCGCWFCMLKKGLKILEYEKPLC